jgi:hypothetical protein
VSERQRAAWRWGGGGAAPGVSAAETGGGRARLLGVRHHGPGSARSVQRALDDWRPDLVLIELPADAEAALRWIGHPGLVAPVALLGYVAARPERAVFAPFAVFSPEWQAAAWAAAHGVAIGAIDLPMAVTLAVPPGARDDEEEGPIDPLGALAAAAGEPDAERWWDDLVEHRGDGAPAFDAVAEAMAAVRAGSSAPRREQRREAHMRRAIRRALSGGAARVAVVCGAWHVPALHLDAPGTPGAGADAATLRALPKVGVEVTWVPWTHRRLARAAGYGAGVASPGWYAHVFGNPGTTGVPRFFVDAAHALRGRGMAASPDHLIAASRLADSLATLRRRPRAGLAEVLDAADAVLGGLPVVIDELVVGDAVGDVPPEAPQVPLARDVAAAQRAVRLRPEPGERYLELDLRTANGRRRSLLLHRMVALGIRWGSLTDGRGSAGTFRESWRLVWEPEWSVRLVELAGHGTTLEAAATSRLVERAAAAAHLADVTWAVTQALLADLPAAVPPCVEALGRRAAHAPDLAELMDAVRPMADAIRYGDVRNTDASGLRAVFDELVVRVVAGLEAAAGGLDDESARAMVERMSAVQAALAVIDHPARRSSYPDVLERLARGGRIHGLVQGRATRLVHDGGRWAPIDVERRLARALSSGTPAATGAAFVEGFLAGSGTILVHDAALLGVVDAWLGSLAPDAFIEAVPLLRRTFGAFEPAERRQLGVLVTTGATVTTASFGADVDDARAQAGLTTVRAMLGIPGHE